MTRSKKRIQAIIVLIIALIIVLVGTFAWNSFNQSKINVFREIIERDVNLHDDFDGGPNKDVYVENSGQMPIFVRIKLTEYLETINRGSLVAGALYNSSNSSSEDDGDNTAGTQNLDWARTTWSPHNALHPVSGDAQAKVEECYIKGERGELWKDSDDFHKFYTWIMGGLEEATKGGIYYKPATEDQKGNYSENGEVIDGAYPQVVSDPLTGTSELGDAHLEYKKMVDALLDTGMTKEAALEQLGLKETKPTLKVITMAEWDKTSGPFWVVDDDGWCYWAEPLEGGDATGLLLDKVERKTANNFDSNAEYAINVWLQAVGEGDFGDFYGEGGGGATDKAKMFLNVISGDLVFDKSADPVGYVKNRDGTFTLADLTTGNAKDGAKPFVLLGDKQISQVAANGDNSFEIGQRFTMGELSWNSLDYENYEGTDMSGSHSGWETLDAAQLWGKQGGEFWNIKKSTVTDNTTDDSGIGSKQIYQLMGVRMGVDDILYLEIAPIVENEGTYEPDMSKKMYIASVKRSEKLSGDYTTDKPWYTYTQNAPGTAPFAFIYPAGTGIGTSKDLRADPSLNINSRHFYHLGNGVYVEVSKDGETTSKDAPVQYFFAGKILSKVEVNKAVTADADNAVKNLFKLQLAEGQTFDAKFTTVNTQEIVGTGDGNFYKAMGLEKDKAYVEGVLQNPELYGEFLFKELTKGANGQWYMNLGTTEDGYIGVGTKKFLGVAESDMRVWMGASGQIGTATDKTTKPDMFGSGTASDPYKIVSVNEMLYIAKQVAAGITYAGTYFEVTKDFDISVVSTKYPGEYYGGTAKQRIGNNSRSFKGIFDGKDHTISNLNLPTGGGRSYGLFGYVESGGVIKNLKVKDATVANNDYYTGIIVGWNVGTVENCEVTGTSILTPASLHSGGIVGYNNGGTVKNSTTSASVISANSYSGGVVGYNNGGTVENCTNTGMHYSSGNYFGGIVGYSTNANSVVKNSTNKGNIVTNGGNYIGGVVGESYGPVTGCKNEGQIGTAAGAGNVTVGGVSRTTNPASYVGGIMGVNYHTVENCQNLSTGVVRGTNYIGGVVSFNNNAANAKIIDSSNAASVFGTGNYTGGVVGRNIGTVTNGTNSGTVTGVGYTAGVAGDIASGGKVTASRNTGNVTSGGNYVGGVAGYNSGTLEMSYSVATVGGGGSYLGGVVGVNQGSGTVGCYAWGNVTGTSYVGGVAGYTNTTLSYSYHAKGTVTGTGSVGGVVGTTYGGSMTRCAAYGVGVVNPNSYKNAIIGYVYSGSYNNCYIRPGFSYSVSNGWAGNGEMAATQADWAAKMGYGFGTTQGTWTWNSAEGLPVATIIHK